MCRGPNRTLTHSQKNNSAIETIVATPSSILADRTSATARYKKLTWFFIAAASVVGSGCVLMHHFNYTELLVILWCTVGGTFLIYRINDYIDTEHAFRFNVRAFLKEKRHMIIVAHLFLIAFPVAFFTITPFSFIVLASVAALGVFYSITFPLGAFQFRLKNVFLLKNISIGIAWGSLVLVGAGKLLVPDVVALFLFTSIQVAIGSMIRDIPDLEKDREAGAKTFPVLYGGKATMRFLFLANILSAAVLVYPRITKGIIGVIAITVLWRTVNLLKLNRNINDRLWGQTLNLFTCTIIFLGVLLKFIVDELARG